MTKVGILWLSVLLCVCGCAVSPRVLEGPTGSRQAFNRVFGSTDENLEVVRGRVIIYPKWWIFAVTTDDGEFELLAPVTWVERHKQRLRGPVPPERVFVVGAYSDWFSPQPEEDFEVYQTFVTSIPYEHLFVSRTPREDGRLQVFFRKD